MRARRLPVPLTLLVAAPLLLAACGSDDGGSEDEDQITAAIEQAATTDEAANCTEVQTQAFSEQTEFTQGAEAVTTCEENAGDGDIAGDSVEVENIEVDGETATADVTFTGGGLNGQALAVSLVKEGGQWKLDSLDEFITFDKASFAQGLVEGASSDGETSQQAIDCIEQAIIATPDEELQTIYLSGDERQLVGLFGQCFQ